MNMLLLKRDLRANHAPYMTKALQKAIIKRSKLKSNYFKNQTAHDFELYKKQKNYCSEFYKKREEKTL